MPTGTLPFRIKLKKLDQKMVDIYNRSSFHRNELLIPLRPFAIELADKKIDLSVRQIVVLPEPIMRRIVLPEKNCDQPEEDHKSSEEKIYAYVLSLADPYLDAIANDFVETPEIKAIFDEPHVFGFTFVTWQHLLQTLIQLQLELKRPEDNIQKKMVFSIVSTIFLDLYRLSSATNQNRLEMSEREILAYEIKHYIVDSYRKDITLQDIADKFDISTSTVNRVFQPYFHSTIYQFILDLRLGYAYSLIESGLSITESWQKAGFNDYSNFYRAFIKHYHIRPHEVPKKRES